MKLDKRKKYLLAGNPFAWFERPGRWDGPKVTFTESQFQHLANNGLVTEVREPLTIEFEVKYCSVNGEVSIWSGPIQTTAYAGKHFRGTLTEVIE